MLTEEQAAMLRQVFTDQAEAQARLGEAVERFGVDDPLVRIRQARCWNNYEIFDTLLVPLTEAPHE